MLALCAAAIVSASVSGCAATPTEAASTQQSATHATTANSPTNIASTAPPPTCSLSAAEALSLAGASHGTLPKGTTFDSAGLTCEPGWAAGVIKSPDGDSAEVVYRAVDDVWQVYLLGTGLCADQEGRQKMAQAPDTIRRAARC